MDYFCSYDYVIPHSNQNVKDSQDRSQPYDTKKLNFTHTPGHRVRGFRGSFIQTHFLSSPFHKGAIPCISPST